MNKYQQDVTSLAWKIIEYAQQDFGEQAEKTLISPELIHEHCDTNPEIGKRWDELDGVSHEICKTHDIDYGQLMQDVWVVMMSIESEEPKVVN